MILVTAIVRPHRLEAVKTAIADLGVTGMSVVEVRGCGNSPEKAATFAGREVLVALPIRAKITVVVHDGEEEGVIQAILSTARIGEPGDGKIFLERIQDAIRIRTLERGETAV